MLICIMHRWWIHNYHVGGMRVIKSQQTKTYEKSDKFQRKGNSVTQPVINRLLGHKRNLYSGFWNSLADVERPY